MALGLCLLTGYLIALCCLLLCGVYHSRVPSRVSKYSSIRKFKDFSSRLLFRSLVSITNCCLFSYCHYFSHSTFKFFPLEEFSSFSKNVYQVSVCRTFSSQTLTPENTAHLSIASSLTHQNPQNLMLYLQWS